MRKSDNFHYGRLEEAIRRFLIVYDYDKLTDAGSVSTEQAEEKTYAEYDKFRLIQDK